MTVQKALSILGFRLVVVVQNKIKSNVPPPNAASTVAAKKRRGVAPRTLIDTTRLLRSIAYQVFVGGGKSEGGSEGHDGEASSHGHE